MVTKCNAHYLSTKQDNITIHFQEKIILVTPGTSITTKAISLFNHQIANINSDTLRTIEEIHLDLKAAQELSFFFIGSILSIFSKLKSAKITIRNASLSTINALNEYGLNKIFTINS
jgi:hypothetical protein